MQPFHPHNVVYNRPAHQTDHKNYDIAVYPDPCTQSHIDIGYYYVKKEQIDDNTNNKKKIAGLTV